MENFSYFNPVKVIFGKGQISKLSEEIPLGSHVLMIYGGGSIKKNGVYDQVKLALKNFKHLEFAGVEPNPTFETLMKAVEVIKKEKVDFLLAVGGGSVLDGTKFIAAAACFQEGDPWKILSDHAPIKRALPLGSVLTLPATGSEMNAASVVTKNATKEKLAFINPMVYPKFSVLDPTTTETLPPRQVGNGIVDAFTHVMEQYMTYPSEAPVQDRFAEGLLKTLIEVGPVALKEPKNYQARANLMWCATMALNGLIGAGVPQDWTTHMIGHELTAKFGLDHAQTLAIVLPNTLRVMSGAKKLKLLQYAERVWDLRLGTDEEKISRAIDKTREFFESVGVKTHLSDYGISASEIPGVVGQLEAHGMTKLGEKGLVTLDVSRQILEAAV